jgi:microcompartment protein CcmK/EutM
VIVAHGSRVRDLTCGPDVADKDIIIAIVDGFEREDGQAEGLSP